MPKWRCHANGLVGTLCGRHSHLARCVAWGEVFQDVFDKALQGYVLIHHKRTNNRDVSQTYPNHSLLRVFLISELGAVVSGIYRGNTLTVIYVVSPAAAKDVRVHGTPKKLER